METYIEMKARHQREFDELPKFAAFNDMQLIEGKAKLGVKDDSEIRNIGCGLFARASDVPLIASTIERQRKELREAMEDYGFAYNAFACEMRNHEYHINWEADYDVLSCFYDVEYVEGHGAFEYLDAIGVRDDTRRAYIDARSAHMRYALENDWV